MIRKIATSQESRYWCGIFVILAIMSLLGPFMAAPPLPDATPRAQPILLQMAAQQPEENVRAIVQELGGATRAEELVSRPGGVVTRDLGIINAFAVELPARSVPELARASSVGWVSLDALVIPAGSAGLLQEAEQATLYGNFTIGQDRNASNGQYIHAPQGSGNFYGGLHTSHRAEFCFMVPAAGTYQIQGWVYAPDGSSDSFYVAVDGSPTAGYEWHTNRNTCYLPEHVDSQGVTVEQYLSAGEHTVTLYVREDGTRLDRLELVLVDGGGNTYLDTLAVRQAWSMGLRGQGLTIAVIDSGISQSQDFGTDSQGNRLLAQVAISLDAPTAADTYGHGTFVGGIIGGNGSLSNGRYVGIAPQANLIGLRISDDTGMARESDTVAAMQWVLEHKDVYNIRVVNLSVNSTQEQSYHLSPLTAAAEILWFNRIVVVTSVGNKGPLGAYDTVNTSPANDPIIITVGATDEHDTPNPSDDSQAPFSAHGTSIDGFYRPDILAPGYDIISVLSTDSSWDVEHPDRVLLDGSYIWLSGTSTAAPMVAAAAALLLQDEPSLTPGQVKYRLVHTANTVHDQPYLNAYAAVTGTTADSANAGIRPHDLLRKSALIALGASQNGGDAIDWGSVNWDSVNWDSVNWDSVNWDSVNWDSVNWDSVNWDSVNWDSVNWDSAYVGSGGGAKADRDQLHLDDKEPGIRRSTDLPRDPSGVGRHLLGPPKGRQDSQDRREKIGGYASGPAWPHLSRRTAIPPAMARSTGVAWI